MIALRILKLLEENGFGTIDVNGTIKTNGLYFEKMPQGATGIAIFSRGAQMDRALRPYLDFDLYSRGVNDVEGYQKLEQIAQLMRSSFTVCSLPVLDGIDETVYTHCSIMPIGNIENAASDENDRVLYVMTSTIRYTPETV
jgi:hypothetical protein